MTDYTQMTDQEFETAILESQEIQAEMSRRDWVRNAPLTLAWLLKDAEERGLTRVEMALKGMNTLRSEMGVGGPEGDIPVIDDAMAAEIITALQARIDAV